MPLFYAVRIATYPQDSCENFLGTKFRISRSTDSNFTKLCKHDLYYDISKPAKSQGNTDFFVGDKTLQNVDVTSNI